jgi:hypothetical protein
LVDPIGYSLFVKYVEHHFVLILLALSSKTQGAKGNDSPQEVFM